MVSPNVSNIKGHSVISGSIKSRRAAPAAFSRRQKARAVREAARIAAENAKRRERLSKEVREMIVRKRAGKKFQMHCDLDGMTYEAFYDCFPYAGDSVGEGEVRLARKAVKAIKKLSKKSFVEQAGRWMGRTQPEAEEPTIKEGLKAAAKLAVGAAKNMIALPGTIRKAQETVDRVQSAVGVVGSTLDTIANTLQSMYDGFCKYFPIAAAGAMFLMFVYWVRGTQNCPNIFITGLGSVMAFIVGEKVWGAVAPHFEQGQIVEQSSIAWVVPALISLVGATHLGADYASRITTGRLIGLLSTLPRATSGLEVLLQWAVKSVETVMNYIRQWMSLPAIRLCEKYGAEIDAILLRVDELDKKDVEGDDSASFEKRYTEVKQLMCEIISFKHMYRSDRDIMVGLNAGQRTLQKIAGPLRAKLGVGCGFTQLPVSVVLSGAPGVGKTMMVQNLVLTICREAGIVKADSTPGEVSRLCFIKPFNSEYMEGYCGQPVYLMDDFMMKKATAQDTTNGLLDLMTYYSSFPAVVNMAACENKGMVPFDSKIILMTTNMKHLDQCNASALLLEPEALKRRVDVQYEVMVKPEYRMPGSHKLDHDKFKVELAKCEAAGGTLLETYPWYIWEIFQSSWDGATVEDSRNGTGKPFLRAIFEIVDCLRLRSEGHEVTMRSSERMLKADVETPESYKEMREKIMQQAGAFERKDALKFQEDAWAAMENYSCHALKEIQEVEEDDDACSVTTSWFEDSWYVKARDSCRYGIKKMLAAFVKFVNDWKPYIRLALGATLAISLCVTTTQALWAWVRKNVFGHDSVQIEEQSNQPYGKIRTVTRLQAANFKEGHHVFVYNNSFKIIVQQLDGEMVALGSLTFTHEDYCVMNLHFKQRILDARKLGLITDESLLILRGCRSGSVRVNSTVGHFLAFPQWEMPEKDLWFMRPVGVFSAHKDIRKFIVRKSDLPIISGEAGRLDTTRVMKNGELIPFNERTVFISTSFRYTTCPTLIGAVNHRGLLEYGAQTVDGDCGAPFCLTNHNNTQCRVWCGMHVGLEAGTSSARAIAICIEDFEKAFKALGKMTGAVIKEQASFVQTCERAGIEVPEGFTLEETAVFPFAPTDATDDEKESYGSFTPIAEVQRPVCSPVKTNFVESFVMSEGLLSDVLDYDLKPMRLAPHFVDGELFFPMVNALKPYSGDVKTVDVRLVESAVFEAARPFGQATVDYHGRKWTVEEAFVGVNGAKGIPLGTSTGLPGCVLYKNKRDMLGGMVDWDFEDEKLKKLVDEVLALEKMLEEGTRPYFLVRGFLKDETRKPGKFARYIAGTNVHYYVLCRMYFGQIVSCQMKHFKKSGMCPGINPYQDWGWLKEFIQQVGEKAWDGDFTGFDTSQQPQMLKACLKYINAWYYKRTEDKEVAAKENAIREILFEDLMKSRHLVGKGSVATHVVQWQRSLPSGHFLTTFINSLLSATCIVAGFMKSTGLDDFWANCRVATLGDDNLTSVKEELVPVFNQKAVAKVLLEEFGMVYTAGRKGEELVETVPWNVLSFLQRTFAEKNGVIVGPIGKKSIYGCLMHLKKATPGKMRETLEQNIEGVLTELSLHPEETWEAESGKVVSIASRLKYDTRFDVSSSRAYFDFACSLQNPGWF